MKKVIAMVICVAMLACFAVTASADTKATFIIDTVEGKKGDIVTINVNVAEEATRIAALGLKFAYDTEALKIVANNRGEYIVAGEALKDVGASFAGNEEIMEIQFAAEGGIWLAGGICTMQFEVLKDIEGTSAITAEVILAPEHGENKDETYTVEIVNGGVKAPAAEPSKDDTSKDDNDDNSPVVTPPVDDTTVTDTDNNPETGDVSGIAVAAGLAAVMAAAFVITKKVND